MNSPIGGNHWQNFGLPGWIDTNHGQAPLSRGNHGNPSPHKPRRPGALCCLGGQCCGERPHCSGVFLGDCGLRRGVVFHVCPGHLVRLVPMGEPPCHQSCGSSLGTSYLVELSSWNSLSGATKTLALWKLEALYVTSWRFLTRISSCMEQVPTTLTVGSIRNWFGLLNYHLVKGERPVLRCPPRQIPSQCVSTLIPAGFVPPFRRIKSALCCSG